jgi:hypothetical protein
LRKCVVKTFICLHYMSTFHSRIEYSVYSCILNTCLIVHLIILIFKSRRGAQKKLGSASQHPLFDSTALHVLRIELLASVIERKYTIPHKPLLPCSLLKFHYLPTIRRLFEDYSYFSSTIRGLFVLFVDYSHYSLHYSSFINYRSRYGLFLFCSIPTSTVEMNRRTVPEQAKLSFVLSLGYVSAQKI